MGGKSGPITVFARDASSGTWDAFRGLILPSGALADGAKRFDSNEALADAVASTPGSIGFASLAAAKRARALSIGEPGAPAVAPTPFAIATETYPLTRRLYLYASRPNLLGDALITFATSPEGQAIVAKAGFIDLSPKSEAASECKGCSPEYRNATRGAVRFQSGSARLDSRGLLDVERVAAFARARKAKRLVLVGFADSRGDPATNLAVSLERAKAVAALIEPKGFKAEALGLGDKMPVASNATAEGRERNRRVEVWVVP